jgi:hypothetical protein
VRLERVKPDELIEFVEESYRIAGAPEGV